jgi:hypothetical protein
MGTTGAQYMSYDRYGKTSHKEGFGSSFIIAGSALKTNDFGGIANARVDLFGADLHDFMIRAKRGLTRIGAFGEELPKIENRIELVSDKDEFGLPLAKIVHSYDKDTEAVWNANFAEGLEIAKTRQEPRMCGRLEVVCRRFSSWAAPLWGRRRAVRWSTATARPTRSPTCMWPDLEFS